MNFSFLDISVKSPQDLNSWNRIKSTLLLEWYSFWRLALTVLGIFIVLIGVVILDGSEETIDNLALYIENLWFEHISILLITLISSIFTYNSLYRKNYYSFKLALNNISKPQFWSGYFWKRYILYSCITLFPYPFIKETNMLMESIFYGTSLLISHFCLHCGFWGVSYEPKQLNNHNDDITN